MTEDTLKEAESKLKVKISASTCITEIYKGRLKGEGIFHKFFCVKGY